MTTRSALRQPIAEGDPLPPVDDLPPPEPCIETLYRAEEAGLIRQLRRRLPYDVASDLVHQVFTRFAALTGRRRAEIADPARYLRRSASNLAVDHARHVASRAHLTVVPLDDIDLRAPDQQAALEARDMLARLDVALRKLNPRTREIFLAHRLDGYTYGEIARRTGLSVKSIEKHMSKAIAYVDRVFGAR